VNRRERDVLIMLLLGAFFGSSQPMLSAASAALSTSKLTPKSYTTLKGATGGQPVSALAVEDQNGSEEDWDKYVEFTTPNVAYSGYRIYQLPRTTTLKAISEMKVAVNFKGPLATRQAWTWKIYDWQKGTWVTLGNNASAPVWVWSEMTFSIPAPFARFIDSSRRLRVLLQSNHQLAYNRFLADAAHARGLAIGLKNDIDQVVDLLTYFDWELNEQCFYYSECDKIEPFVKAGKPIFNIEYELTTQEFCPQANALNFNSLRKDLNLSFPQGF
jgi:hypothetical protein